MAKTKIAILLGGTSSEHEISLKSGSFIFKTLDRSKYEVMAVPISKTGNWLVPENYENNLPDWKSLSSPLKDSFFKEFTSKNHLRSSTGVGLASMNADLIFLGLHGGEGENGTIQGLLDSYKIPYTGSGVLASALAMDKERSGYIFLANGFTIPLYQCLTRREYYKDKEAVLTSDNIPIPVFIKPTFGGSSVGAGAARTQEELEGKLTVSFATEDSVILQELIHGTEVSCGVLEKKSGNYWEPYALPPTEIVPKTQFFDFEAKYTAGKSEEITPARLSKELTQKVQIMAVRAHIILGCRGYSRTDFIIKDDIPYILETNTLPGMTETSLIPQQAAAINMSMNELFDNLIKNGKERFITE